jgi:hypothetical protein
MLIISCVFQIVAEHRPWQTVDGSAGRSNNLISVTSPFGFRNKNNWAGEMRSFRCMFQCNSTSVPLRHTSKSLEGSKFQRRLGKIARSF